ncbi:MAG: hypothetical protein VB860_10585 [Dehalococcoidia bacterium]
MPRRNNRRTSQTQNQLRGRRERTPNVFTGPVPEDKNPEDDDLLLDELDESDLGEDDDSTEDATAATGGAGRGRRAERRRAARARRGAGARNRAAVFSQNLPQELKKLGVMVGGTVIILGVLTVFLG